MRRDKINYYLDLAEVVSQRCTCLRRHYGAVIVKDDEVNAIISASRRDMLGADLYLTGTEVSDGSYIKNAVCCSMCKRLVINAGIARVFVRDDKDRYRVIDVGDWVTDDESLRGELGY